MENKNLEMDYEFNKDHPLSFYPRPKLKKKMDDGYYLNLNGIWKYEIASFDTSLDDLSFASEIIVPYPIESVLSGVGKFLKKKEVLYYYKKIIFNKSNDRIILHFGAIDQISYIYINKKLVYTNIGGYLPFEIDITDYVDDNSFELIVKVIDKLDYKLPYGKQSKKPHGIWYTPISGIWKSVWVESVPNNYVKDINISSNILNKEIIVNLISNYEIDKSHIIVKYNNNIIYDDIHYSNIFKIVLADIKLWSPEEPDLYDIIIDTGNEIIETYTNFRCIELKEYNNHQIIHLNNQPYFCHGLLDQGYYPDGLYTPRCEKVYLDELLRIKELGFNTLRKHIKIEEEYWYYLCDKVGILVFQDMVNCFKYNFFFNSLLPMINIRHVDLMPRLYKKEDMHKATLFMCNTIKLLKNYHCIILWTIFNEGWGEFKIKDNLNIIKTVDNTRLIDLCSGWRINKYNDFLSLHIYFKPYKYKKHNASKALIMSEFGGYSLYLKDHAYSNKVFGYKGMKNIDEFNIEFKKLYEHDIIPNIKNGLCASIYTQVSDVEEEVNGIFSYDRKVVKLDKEVALSISKLLKF